MIHRSQKTTQNNFLSREEGNPGTGGCASTPMYPGYWSIILLLYVCVVLQPDLAAAETHSGAFLQTYDHGGTICFKCPAGSHVVRHCTDKFTYSDCDPCPPGSYQETHTAAERCGACSTCPDKNMVVDRNCNATHDTRCECMPGYYRLDDDGHNYMKHHVCLKHTECRPGQVVVKEGSATTDAECGHCPSGQFLSTAGQCEDCGVCEDTNMTLVTPCDVTADTVCDMNRTGIGVNTTTEVLLTKTGSGFIWQVAVVGAVLVLVAIGVVCVLCHCRRCSKKKVVEDAENLRPMLQRTMSSGSTASTNDVAKREHLFPELKDPAIWKDDVFGMLEKRLTNWPAFIRNLPGDRQYKDDCDSRCEHIQMDHPRNVQEQIHQGLRFWFESRQHTQLSDVLSAAYETCGAPLHDELCKLCAGLTHKTQGQKPDIKVTSV